MPARVRIERCPALRPFVVLNATITVPTLVEPARPLSWALSEGPRVAANAGAALARSQAAESADTKDRRIRERKPGIEETFMSPSFHMAEEWKQSLCQPCRLTGGLPPARAGVQCASCLDTLCLSPRSSWPLCRSALRSVGRPGVRSVPLEASLEPSPRRRR